MRPKYFLSALVLIGLISGFLILSIIPKLRGDDVKGVSKELDDNLRMDSVMGRVLTATFESLRHFKNENGYLPPEDNQSTAAALSGKNKTGKNYIANWDPNLFDAKGRLLDVKGEAVVFHFINVNHITIYSPGTKQLLDGALDSDKVSLTGSP